LPPVKWLNRILGGKKKMAALTAGTPAPDFTLPAMDGKQFSLKEALAHGPVLLAFFKISCPVCQFAFPYIERIHQAYKNPSLTIVGVSQNDKKQTAAFIKEYGMTFPVLFDDTETYPVSNAYGLTNVPSLFWIAPGGEVEISSVGWSRKDIEEIGQKAAQSGAVAPMPIFRAGESVPDFRAG
jgi:peroxiredoxin